VINIREDRKRQFNLSESSPLFSRLSTLIATTSAPRFYFVAVSRQTGELFPQ
jgi:hypothetical protein